MSMALQKKKGKILCLVTRRNSSYQSYYVKNSKQCVAELYLNVTSGTGHLTPLWKGCLKEIVWLDWSTDTTSP